MDIEISWFGRCCFLVELNNKRILFDPYDTYCNVDIGTIDSDMVLISSTWHDHGHIGASPKSWIFSYPGITNHSGFVITGIEAKENRGSPTIIFNLKYEGVSITNFADLGAKDDEEFDKNLSDEQRTVLKSTNIAFVRPSIEGDEITENNIHNEKFLKYCEPNIIFPEHFFPKSFIQEKIPNEKKAEFLKPNIIVDELIEKLQYPVDEIDDYKITLNSSEIFGESKIVKLLKLNPQVVYAG